jgi:adenylylsulfate kinase
MSDQPPLIAPPHLTVHPSQIQETDRHNVLKQKGCVFWFTGLSGSGKSTTAMACEHALIRHGQVCFVLDGDGIRTRLNADLGFSASDRTENLRRVAECARLFAQAGLITLVSFISPTQESRQQARSIIEPFPFYEVYMSASLDICESRDPKGLYKKARAGEILNFTGVSAPYEVPLHPDLVLSAHISVENHTQSFLSFLKKAQLISPPST